jgi:hypothetical protein
MDWALRNRAIEGAAEVSAAACFAAAVAFALWSVAVGGPMMSAAAGAAFVLVYAGLRHVPAEEPTYALPGFAPAPLETMAVIPVAELLLEDELAGIAPDARVVQLFGRGEQPVRPAQAASEPPDASQALSDALAELRRILR